ncbi:TetR/AcrR family transcriptional regulator [Amycolatopsis sp. SID8362]|uniref:TetR/AcrR family transcriptional regulator n=1 Tax=Amycolatopsis sp. SID8362 TaxID=2690346 RepID=UPI0013706B7E|nr:TetR/AcrR family transcriptional regulator [Amycolatopsis sp. SID8362]NBH06698.1 TetR family transcriptional regulator [Amycolatopsis sp. SID8362]NED43395.1 TetR/AcrR family transcriptional regulator [Amycolatopsis sp. SID8362]
MSLGERRIQPRKQPRQVRAELTRQRILTAAAHVFGEFGYAAGTTNRIAEHAGISIGSLYQYFPNKDAILAELLVRHLDEGTAATERIQRAELPGSIEEIFRVFVRGAIETHLGNPQLLRLLMEQAPRSKELLDKVERLKQSLVSYVQELFDTHPEVRVADTETAARLCVTTTELVVHQLVADHEPVDAGRLENEMVAMLTRYVTG